MSDVAAGAASAPDPVMPNDAQASTGAPTSVDAPAPATATAPAAMVAGAAASPGSVTVAGRSPAPPGAVVAGATPPAASVSGGAQPAPVGRAGAVALAEPMGSFDAEGNYVPRSIVADDLDPASLDAAIGATIVEFDDGDIVEGVVVKIDKDEVLLDIGFKSEGVIPSRELSIRNDVDPAEIVSLGERIEALVLQKEDKEGRLVLSKKRAQYERAWGTIERLKETDGVVRGPVIEVVKGGLIVDIGLRGFLPASLVELRRVRELQPYVGRSIEAKIIELDRNRNNVVLSRRAWLEETQREQRGDFLANLKPGERRRGVVSSVVNFGAFVDLGGMDGLIHVSELSWKHVDHPSSVVAVGDEVDVEVLDVDLDKERISLSLKNTQTDPWQEFADTHQVGELVYGRITKLVPFGSFVQVGDGIEGLVHISEMAVHHVDLPEQVVTPGEELWVKIIDIDLQRRRISLSIKQAAEGGEVSEEYREAFGEHAYDDQGNYIGYDYAAAEFTPETEAQAAWADFAPAEVPDAVGSDVPGAGGPAGAGAATGAGAHDPAADAGGEGDPGAAGAHDPAADAGGEGDPGAAG
ncbi:MAG: 30S ribosomal protein S1 [Actinomycetota bacterium]|jgi:small subunit ribosomal protein S1|nr:30S ribosomal protein S1 [Actinomycetota bacterium]